MRTKYKTTNDLLRIVKYRNFLNKNQIKLIYPVNKLKLVLGLGCLVVAVIPNGTGIFLYPLSFMLLGISLNDLIRIKENFKLRLWGFKK